jgi:nucleotide-binding universal stress UspA family protein
MAEPYRVLVPLDGSRLAESALGYLPALKHLGEIQVTLLAVADSSSQELDEEGLERELRLLSSYLDDLKPDIRTCFGLEADLRIETGIPAEVILEVEEETKPHLVALSTHGRTGLARWRLGSVADKVIRGGGCNMLVLGLKAAERVDWRDSAMPALRNILVPLDGSKVAEMALPVADSFAPETGAQLHLLRVLTPMIHTEKPMSPDGEPSRYFSTVPQAEEYLARAAQRLSEPSQVKLEVRLGWPEDEINVYAAGHNVDLIVLTTHGRTGLARVALGSVTDHLLGGPVPLLVVRSHSSA